MMPIWWMVSALTQRPQRARSSSRSFQYQRWVQRVWARFSRSFLG